MMTRTPKQRAALEKFISALATVRKFKDIRYQMANTPTELLVRFELKEAPDFPIISIGGGGGFGMPDIPSYANATDRIAKTPFEACLWGEKYVQARGSGAANTSPRNNVPWESE